MCFHRRTFADDCHDPDDIIEYSSLHGPCQRNLLSFNSASHNSVCAFVILCSFYFKFSSIMGTEMSLSNLHIGLTKGVKARRLNVLDAPPDPKQTKLRCFRCLNYLTCKTTPQVLQETPLLLKPKWLCLSIDIASCSVCPLCTRDDSFTQRRVHLCPAMVQARQFLPIILPVRTMLDYGRCNPGCPFCGFQMDHIVCECP